MASEYRKRCCVRLCFLVCLVHSVIVFFRSKDLFEFIFKVLTHVKSKVRRPWKVSMTRKDIVFVYVFWFVWFAQLSFFFTLRIVSSLSSKSSSLESENDWE